MEWARNPAANREFERFAAEVSDPLLRTAFLMTGNAKDTEDLVQETLLKVARRWSRVRSMDRPAAYARRVLINLVLHDADRRTRQQIELHPHQRAAETADEKHAVRNPELGAHRGARAGSERVEGGGVDPVVHDGDERCAGARQREGTRVR